MLVWSLVGEPKISTAKKKNFLIKKKKKLWDAKNDLSIFCNTILWGKVECYSVYIHWILGKIRVQKRRVNYTIHYHCTQQPCPSKLGSEVKEQGRRQPKLQQVKGKERTLVYLWNLAWFHEIYHRQMKRAYYLHKGLAFYSELIKVAIFKNVL